MAKKGLDAYSIEPYIITVVRQHLQAPYFLKIKSWEPALFLIRPRGEAAWLDQKTLFAKKEFLPTNQPS